MPAKKIQPSIQRGEILLADTQNDFLAVFIKSITYFFTLTATQPQIRDGRVGQDLGLPAKLYNVTWVVTWHPHDI